MTHTSGADPLTPQRRSHIAARLATDLLPKYPQAARQVARFLRGMAAVLNADDASGSARCNEQPKWRSPLLGQRHLVELDEGPIEYYERGTGPTILLLHGWLANANLWRNVVDALHESFRCITVDLPVGSHRQPMPATADLSPDGIAGFIGALLAHLDCEDVTIVGNDSGGAYAQIAIARHTHRAGRLVLSSSETPLDHWPPTQFDYLCRIARNPEALRELAEGLRNPHFRKIGYGPDSGLTKRLPPEHVVATYALPISCDEQVRANTAAVINSVSTAALHAASRQIATAAVIPVLLIWSEEDPVFPARHAKEFAQALPNGQIVIVDDAYSFTPEDQPEAVAAAIGDFVRAYVGG